MLSDITLNLYKWVWVVANKQKETSSYDRMFLFAEVSIHFLYFAAPVSCCASCSSRSLSVSSTLMRTNSVNSLLITSSFSCTIFSDMVFCLLSNGGVVTPILSETLNLVFFYLRNLLYLISSRGYRCEYMFQVISSFTCQSLRASS
jgi:hypothetical protein